MEFHPKIRYTIAKVFVRKVTAPLSDLVASDFNESENALERNKR